MLKITATSLNRFGNTDERANSAPSSCALLDETNRCYENKTKKQDFQYLNIQESCKRKPKIYLSSKQESPYKKKGHQRTYKSKEEWAFVPSNCQSTLCIFLVCKSSYYKRNQTENEFNVVKCDSVRFHNDFVVAGGYLLFCNDCKELQLCVIRHVK
jgi:hypothetical protein